jgi:VCBS repeat-containing protein
MADTRGTSGDDIINGSTGSDKLIGGAGNDTLDGGKGSDFLNAGGGDDTIVYDEADYKILGGGGFDTLWFKGEQQKLDLRNNKIINGIEKLWLDGGGGHSVWFNAADIVRLSDTDQMIINGDAGNRIYPGSGWSFAGLTSDGQSQILTNGGATLIVSLPVYVEGFSNNASLAVNGVTSLTEDSPLEASVLMASGAITVTDLNAGQALLLANAGSPFTSVGSTMGALTVALDGSATGSGSTVQSYNYVYQIDNAEVQYLGAGKTLEESFTIKTIDGSSLDLKFVTTGVNDTALFGAPTNPVVTEDLNGGDATVLQAIGNITVTDVDENEAALKTIFTSAQGNLGTLELQSGGSYIYSVSNNAVKYLGANDSKVDSFYISSTDGTPNTLSFTINGMNNPAVIGTPTVNSVTENRDVVDGYLQAIGKITVADVDENEAALKTTFTSAQGNLGTLELQEDGSYNYSVSNNAVKYLGANASKVDSFYISSADGTPNTLSFTINGINNPAFIGTPTVNSVTENTDVVDGYLQAIGKITVTDVDENEAALKTTFTSAQGNLGTLELQEDGSYNYSVSNNAVRYLGANASKVDSFYISSADGTPNTLSFTINGINNPAAIGTPTDNSVTEYTDVVDRYLQAIGNISITDPDANEQKFTASDFTGKFGSLNLLENGDYTYSVLNKYVEYLEPLQTVNDNFKIFSTDGTSKDITFEIIGFDEPISIGTPDAYSFTQGTDLINGDITLAGVIPVFDKDPGERGFQTTVTSATSNIGKLVLDTNGGFSYTIANKALSGISQNSDTFTVASLDGTSNVISFTINNGNDGYIFDTSIAPQTSDSRVIFGLNRADFFDCRGVDQKIYGHGGEDVFSLEFIRYSIIQGGDDDDVFYIQSVASSNNIYGDNGDDKFIISSNARYHNLLGGQGSDTYEFVAGTENSSLAIQDFDFSSPNAGGDRIVFTGFEADDNPNTMNLALTESSPSTGTYFLTADEGSGRYTILTLIGTDLTMSDLADNIAGYTG